MTPEQKQELERLNSAGWFDAGRLDIGFDYTMKSFFPAIALLTIAVTFWPESDPLFGQIIFFPACFTHSFVFKQVALRRFGIKKDQSKKAYGKNSSKEVIGLLLFTMVLAVVFIGGVWALLTYTQLSINQSILVMLLCAVPFLTVLHGKFVVARYWKATQMLPEKKQESSQELDMV